MSVDWRLGLAPDVGGNAFSAFMQGQQAQEADKSKNALTAYATNPNAENLNALAPYQPQMVIQQKQAEQEKAAKLAEQKLIGDALTSPDPNVKAQARQQLAYTNSKMYLDLDDRQKKDVDAVMSHIGQSAFKVLQLPEDQQNAALDQVIAGLKANNIDTSSFARTGNAKNDLMVALAVSGQLDKYEKFAQPNYVPVGEGGLAGFQFGQPIQQGGQPQNFGPPQQGAAPSFGGPTPNQGHIDYLRKNPNTKAAFDAKFGAGAADKILGGGVSNGPGGFRPLGDARTAVKQVFPNAKITDWKRAANSSLGRANPDSFHVMTGAAVDMAPIPGMTFQQAVERFARAGYTVHRDSRDEVNNPSGHATGPHWHFVLGGR